MKNRVFEIVHLDKTEYLSYEEVKEKYTIIGFNSNPRQREELQGSPKLKGFLGAMWGGYKDGIIPVMRYETQQVYNILST